MGSLDVLEYLGMHTSKHQHNTGEDDFIFHEDNLQRYESSILNALALIKKTIGNNEKPFSGILPHELASQFAGIDLDTPLGSVDAALKEIESIYLKDAVFFHNKKYLAHLNCPVVYPAVMAELILSSINSSMDTWDQSVGGTLIEQKIIDWSCEHLKLGQQADGVFTSGGSQANLMAMLLARDHYCHTQLNQHSNKHCGLPECANKFRIFTSEMSHFSVQKSAALLGLGYDAVITVDCDHKFKMKAAALRKAIAAAKNSGLIPIAVMATAGTTDFGSIDPLHQIADICDEFGLWMHADAAYGCGLMASNTRRHLLSGIERADSITMDYHKSFLQPVSSSAFLVKDKANLNFVTHHAEYLNPLSAHQEGTPNLVNKSLQTTRRFDALKLWLTLRIMGLENIGRVFDQVCALARSSHLLCSLDPDLDVIHEPELSTLVFRFNPALPAINHSHAHDLLVDKCNQHIRKAIFRSGEAVIAGTRVYDRSYLKFTLLNPQTSLLDIQSVLKLIKQHGFEYLQKNAERQSTLIPALTNKTLEVTL